MIHPSNLTATERRLFGRLKDGDAVPKSSLKALLNDELATDGTFHDHITNLRKKLGPHGLDITSRGHNGQAIYRLVRHISSGE